MNKRQIAMEGNEKLISCSKIKNKVGWRMALGSLLPIKRGAAIDKQKVGR